MIFFLPFLDRGLGIPDLGTHQLGGGHTIRVTFCVAWVGVRVRVRVKATCWVFLNPASGLAGFRS